MKVPAWSIPRRGGGVTSQARAAADGMRYASMLLLLVSILLTSYEVAGSATGGNGPEPGGSYLAWVWLMFSASFVRMAPIAIAMVAVSLHAPERGFSRLVWLAGALLLSSLLGAVLDTSVANGTSLREAIGAEEWPALSSEWLSTWFPAGLLIAVYELHRKDVRAVEEALNTRTARAALDAELGKARLQALRAQIEPHFLFNTLANVRRLHQLDARAGTEMLDSLIRYLATALPGMRRDRTSLREEAVLIGAYLDIYRVRMDTRLAYEIAFPLELLDAALPPMMLLTLVENAIKHGLAPLPEGGVVRVSAERLGQALQLRVADSGCGMRAGSGHGSGLANIRARLAGYYGESAHLSLSLNQPRGVTATLTLPAEALA